MISLLSIPNLLTLGNLFCGAFGIYLFFNGRFDLVFYTFMGSLVFDFLDGFAARKLNQSSPIGVQLDSLADLISFGLQPSIAWVILLSSYFDAKTTIFAQIYIVFPLLVTLFTALRLAKFNIEQRSANYFYGLNSPSNAFFMLGVFFSWIHLEWFRMIITSFPLIIWLLTLASSFLLISDIPMLSNKSLNISQLKHPLLWLFLGIVVICLVLYGYLAMTIAILLYIVASILLIKNSEPN
ncbi:MAG: CDP-alcohol phosphatidyltransferase family protein [Chitinophagales bacterium]|jgi:CDP-diacylglycerol--serine O-phosphatidyltransferase|nr:CDP-alcohol phosphatidyltransferase family protein [Chitinophagales bacterium]